MSKKPDPKKSAKKAAPAPKAKAKPAAPRPFGYCKFVDDDLTALASAWQAAEGPRGYAHELALAMAQRLLELAGSHGTPRFDLAATLLGSGGAGITAGTAPGSPIHAACGSVPFRGAGRVVRRRRADAGYGAAPDRAG